MSRFTYDTLVEECAHTKQRLQVPDRRRRQEIYRDALDALNAWIRDRLVAGKGVHIPNFGRFTWETYKTHSKVDGKSVWKRRKRPVFLPTDAFVRAHGIRWKPPVVPPELETCEEINFSRLAIKYSTTLTKDFAFSCTRDVIQRLGTAIGTGRVVAVEFAVGHLLAKEGRLRFVFGPEVEEEGPRHYRDDARANMLRSVTVGAESPGGRPSSEAGNRPPSQTSRRSARPSSRLSEASDAVLDRSASQRVRPDSHRAPSRRSRGKTSRGHSRRGSRRGSRHKEEESPSPPQAMGSPLYEVPEEAPEEEEEEGDRGPGRPQSEAGSKHERGSAPGWAGGHRPSHDRGAGASPHSRRRRSWSRTGRRASGRLSMPMDDAASNPWAASTSSPYVPVPLGAGSPPVPAGGVEHRLEALAAKQAHVIESAYSRHRARVAQDIEEDAHEEEYREQALQEAESIARDEREERRRREREVREQQERQAQERRRREEEERQWRAQGGLTTLPTFTKAPAYGLMERGGEGGSTVGSDHPRGTSKRVLADTLRSQIEERERHRREQREREVAQERDFIHHLNRELQLQSSLEQNRRDIAAAELRAAWQQDAEIRAVQREYERKKKQRGRRADIVKDTLGGLGTAPARPLSRPSRSSTRRSRTYEQDQEQEQEQGTGRAVQSHRGRPSSRLSRFSVGFDARG